MSLEPGLSFDQAPPISVPFRFFLSAPLFALLAALLALWYGPALISSRWQPAALALAHLMSVGFLGFVMVGAMMQMLPVVAGAPVARPVGVARALYLLLLPGVLSLAGGFLFAAHWPMRLGMALLGAGFLIFVVAVGSSLKRAPSRNPVVLGMHFAVAALVVTVALGLTLASNYGWEWWLLGRVRLANLHLAWGLLGWVGLLVISVAYQVVPMFQLTPVYPKLLTRWLGMSLFALLLLWSATLLMQDEAAQDRAALIAGLLAAAGFGAFAATTLRLQWQRRRKQSDVTLLFWRFGMACLLLALVLLLGAAGQVLPAPARLQIYNFALAFLFIAGFAVSVVSGMLYKIVPFLIWFHLQSQLMGVAKVPNMKQIMPEKGMRRQMWLHFAAVPVLVLSAFWPPLIYPAALLFGASMILLEINLLSAFRIYRQSAKLAPQAGPQPTR